MFGAASLAGVLWSGDYWSPGRIIVATITVSYITKRLVDKYRRPKINKFLVSRYTNQQGLLVLHQFRRGKYCPNLSPFALKLECFLRLAGIPYIVDNTKPSGPKGKCPWVNLEDGEPLGDSQFIINTITEIEKAKGEAARLPIGGGGLSRKERGALQGMRALVEEQLFHCIIYWRYSIDRCKVFLTTQRFPSHINRSFPIFMPPVIKKKATMQGIGVHSPDEVYRIAEKICRALDNYLGDAEYFCGPQPGSEDCAIFGGLAQIMWNAPGTRYEAIVTEMYPRLSAFCLRMKEKIFPDWQELTSVNNNVDKVVGK